MNNRTPKSIVDKNGKQTTVHVNPTKTSKGAARVSSVPTAPTTKPDLLDYDTVLAHVREISEDATVKLRKGEWVITIPLPMEPATESGLPARFEGTAAWEAHNTPEGNEGGSALDEWSSHNDYYSEDPLWVTAEKYNMAAGRYANKREWLDNALKESGLRGWDALLERGDTEANAAEKALIHEWLEKGGLADQYADELEINPKDGSGNPHERLKAAGF